MKKGLLTAAVAALGIGTLSAQEIATWANWCKSAVTFTFDDAANEVNSHKWAADQLDNYGFKATFYMVTGWAGSNWGVYKGFANNGHEIGSHTDSHNSSNTGELASSKKTIEQNIGQPCLTIAYPNCNHMGSGVLQHYIGGRMCGGQTNTKSPSDLSKFDCAICGTQGLKNSGEMTSRCEGANGGWMVFLIHGIDGYAGGGSYSPTSKDAFTGTLKWLKDHESTYWVCTARDAIMYLKERDNAKFKKTGGDASIDIYSLTVDLDKTLCEWDYPLSLRVPMQDGWSDIKVTQNDEEIESEVKNGYVYFKAKPNKGEIVVGSGAPAVPDPEFSFINPTSAQEWCKDSTYTISWDMNGDTNGKEFTLSWSTGSSASDIDVSSVSASSEWSNDDGTFSWGVDNILSDDGSHGESSRWGSTSGKDEYVIFNFSTVQTVGGVKIDEFTKYGTITSFEIQYDDNGSWKTAYQGTSVGEDFTATFSPVSSKKMRLYIKSATDGVNINYVAFTGVAGADLKTGITSAGSFTWKPNTTGNGNLTITKANGKAIATSAAIKISNCGGGDDPDPITGNTGFFDENGAYFGPTCESDGTSSTGAFYTGNYTSPFATVLGKSEEDIQKKLDQLWDHYFKGSNKVYYDKGSEAYILDTGNNDVRSEGMSYGMMICVQTNHKEEFDKLWSFAKNHMWHKSGQWDGYFAWQCGTDGSQKDQNCAPDGEMYFMTALLFAANRWNDSKYMDDAQYILSHMWKGGTGSLFNESQKVVTFQPYNCSDFSDPSYDLPAFVDLFSRWSKTNNSKWAEAATATRNHLYKSSNPTSGLFSDYNNFDGTPKSVSYNNNAQKYMYDAMRCAMNFGMDYYLFGVDKDRQETMAKRIIDFFEKDGYQHARFDWDGSNPGESYTLGETGANAVACYALLNNPSYEKQVRTNLNKAWNAGLATGTYRYYDGLVHYLSMLHLCGSFKIWKPAPEIKEKEIKSENGKDFVDFQGVTYKHDTTVVAFEDCQLYNVAIKITSDATENIANVNAGVQLTPNPNDGSFTLVSNEEVLKVEIINTLGVVVATDYSSDVRANLVPGTYFVRVTTKKGVNHVKMMVAK